MLSFLKTDKCVPTRGTPKNASLIVVTQYLLSRYVSARRHIVRILYHIFLILSIRLHINGIYPINKSAPKRRSEIVLKRSSRYRYHLRALGEETRQHCQTVGGIVVQVFCRFFTFDRNQTKSLYVILSGVEVFLSEERGKTEER